MLLDVSFTELKTIDKIIKILPLFSPIVIFSFGYFLKFLDEKRNILREIGSTQAYCISWLKSSANNIKNLQKNTYEYSTYIKDIDNKVKGFDRHNIMINKINEIKFLQIYNTFVTNKIGDEDYKMKLYFDFCNNVEVLDLNYKSLEDLFNRFTKTEEIFGKKYINNELAFREFRSQIDLSNEYFPDYILFLKNAYTNSKSTQMTISNLLTNIVLPFKDKYSDFSAKYPNDQNLNKLFQILDDIHITCNQWIEARIIISDNFKVTIDRIGDCYNKLNLTINNINEMKFKCLIQLK